MKTGGMAMRGTDEMISAQEEFLSRMDEAYREKVIGVRLEPTGPDPRRDMIGVIRLAWGISRCPSTASPCSPPG